ncbi:MAG TPA: hypothetical protein VKZ65_02700, partial [Glycomyces sp.]|nr:hypothetical protein [Glycomyces sp.]
MLGGAEAAQQPERDPGEAVPVAEHMPDGGRQQLALVLLGPHAVVRVAPPRDGSRADLGDDQRFVREPFPFEVGGDREGLLGEDPSVAFDDQRHGGRALGAVVEPQREPSLSDVLGDQAQRLDPGPGQPVQLGAAC